MQENRELRQRALEVLTECDMERKLLMTRQLVEDWDGRKIGLDADAVLAERDPVPGLKGSTATCPGAYRIQRHQSGAGCRLALCRHAARLL
jgi:hypothetical protein